MISFISSIEIISVVHFAKSKGCIPGPNIFFWITVSVAKAAIRRLLVNGVGTFFSFMVN